MQAIKWTNQHVLHIYEVFFKEIIYLQVKIGLVHFLLVKVARNLLVANVKAYDALSKSTLLVSSLECSFHKLVADVKCTKTCGPLIA